MAPHKTAIWCLTGDSWALYTEDPVVAEAASKNGLRRMAEYYRLQGDGRPVAWQFVGPKDGVLIAAKGIALQPGEGEENKRGTETCAYSYHRVDYNRNYNHEGREESKTGTVTPEPAEMPQPREPRRRNREKDGGGGQGRVQQLRLF